MSYTKESLLAHYATGDIHEFRQIDGWMDKSGGIDTEMHPDEDGDYLITSQTTELRHSHESLAVRIFIHEGTDPKDVARLIRKMLDWIERDPKLFSWEEKEASD